MYQYNIKEFKISKQFRKNDSLSLKHGFSKKTTLFAPTNKQLEVSTLNNINSNII